MLPWLDGPRPCVACTTARCLLLRPCLAEALTACIKRRCAEPCCCADAWVCALRARRTLSADPYGARQAPAWVTAQPDVRAG